MNYADQISKMLNTSPTADIPVYDAVKSLDKVLIDLRNQRLLPSEIEMNIPELISLASEYYYIRKSLISGITQYIPTKKSFIINNREFLDMYVQIQNNISKCLDLTQTPITVL